MAAEALKNGNLSLRLLVSFNGVVLQWQSVRPARAGPPSYEAAHPRNTTSRAPIVR